MSDDGYTRGEAIDVLRAWLLTEHAHAHGGVADEVLNYLQDRVTHLFGPRALIIAGEFLERNDGDLADLASVARRPDRLQELLGTIEEGRRGGFEGAGLFWASGGAPVEGAGRQRMTALLVMAEHGVEDPVWNRPAGDGCPVSLSELGVSQGLVQRLRQWNDTFERLALTDFEWPSPAAEQEWVQHGLRLAHLLQRELPDIDVRYFHSDDDRPLRDGR